MNACVVSGPRIERRPALPCAGVDTCPGPGGHRGVGLDRGQEPGPVHAMHVISNERRQAEWSAPGRCPAPPPTAGSHGQAGTASRSGAGAAVRVVVRADGAGPVEIVRAVNFHAEFTPPRPSG